MVCLGYLFVLRLNCCCYGFNSLLVVHLWLFWLYLCLVLYLVFVLIVWCFLVRLFAFVFAYICFCWLEIWFIWFVFVLYYMLVLFVFDCFDLFAVLFVMGCFSLECLVVRLFIVFVILGFVVCGLCFALILSLGFLLVWYTVCYNCLVSFVLFLGFTFGLA